MKLLDNDRVGLTVRDLARRALVLSCCVGATLQLAIQVPIHNDTQTASALLATTDWMTRANVEKGIRAHAWVKEHCREANGAKRTSQIGA